MEARLKKLVECGVSHVTSLEAIAVAREGHNVLLLKVAQREEWSVCPLVNPKFRSCHTTEESVSKLLMGLEAYNTAIQSGNVYNRFVYVKSDWLDPDDFNVDGVTPIAASRLIEENELALIQCLDICPLQEVWDTYSG